MIKRICLIALTATAFTVLEIPATAQTVTYDVTINVTSGPLMGQRYIGETSLELSRVLKKRNESIQPISITFNFGDIEFTETDDVRDVDAYSPRANFNDGNFEGITYIVSRFGDHPTDIPQIDHVSMDGFVVDNSAFGYVVGANLYSGVVNYTAPPKSPPPEIQTVPEPSLWLGLVTAGCGCWLTRRQYQQQPPPS